VNLRLLGLSLHLCLVGVLVFLSQFSLAQTQSESLTYQSLAMTKAPEELSNVKKEFSGYLRLESISYPTNIPEQPRLNRSVLTSTNFRADFQSKRMHNRVDVTAGKELALGGSTFGISELFTSVRFQSQNTDTVALGRRKAFWSQLDQDWQLGLWQPKVQIDALRPEDQGLTGAFYHLETDSLSILGFVSPLFIPTMGPDIKEKDGGLESDSRWYRSPSRTFEFQAGQDTRLAYDLDIPDINELINNPGYGLRAAVGNKTLGFWGSASYGYKPINALLLKYKTSLFLPETDPSTGEVVISPSVGYHTVYGGDLGYKAELGNLTISYVEDEPIRKFASDNWVMQQPQPMQAASFHFDTDFGLGWFHEPILFGFNYLKIWGGGIRDFDAEGNEKGAIFDNRFKFTHAASLQFDFTANVWAKTLNTRFRYMRELDQMGTLINTEFSYYPVRDIALVLGADILGVDKDKESDLESRFLNQFRANDRVYGGLSYVF
jgi:hypothetical protein